MTLATETSIREPAALSNQWRVGRQHQGASKVVAFIGAGFSATMAAIHLRHALPPDWIIVLLDRTGRFARGPAYAARGAPHLLPSLTVVPAA